MNAKLYSYLTFENAGEALQYYQEEFGATVLSERPFTEEQAEHLGLQVDDLSTTTAYAEFSIAGQRLICADAIMGQPQSSSQVAIMLDFGDDEGAAKAFFDRVSASNRQRVTIPFGPHQQGGKLGYIVDRFGVNWAISAGLINHDDEDEQ